MNDAKLFLMKVRVYNSLVDSKLDEISHLRSVIEKVTASYSSDPGVSGSSDKMGDTIAKIVDLEADLNHSVDVYVDTRKQVQKTIEKIQDPDQYSVLYKRYFEFKKWEQIACEMGFTYRWILKIHGRALQELEKILKEERIHHHA